MEKLGSTLPPPLDPGPPRLSVIVPVRNGADVLGESLAALRASDFPSREWELIVVDDASTDRSVELAEQYADAVLRLPVRQGAASARNRGAERALGAGLVFVDADVCVHPDVLRRFAEIFARETSIAAVFGAYDTEPRAPGLVSQYRNLLHHYIHAQSPGDAETFWTGCGAIRREVFADAGGFDEELQQLEDIELGYRARALGYRIVLRPEIQGTHLKRWTLRSMVTTDLFGRGMTWMRLRLERGRPGRPDTLNLRPAEKLHTLLTGLAIGALVVAAGRQDAVWLLVAAGCLLIVLVGNAVLFRWFARQRGFWFALRIVPLRLLYYALNGIAAVVGWVRHARAPRAHGSRLATRAHG
jgi:glycosyltransferase involved in cell wall biosynthesis